MSSSVQLYWLQRWSVCKLMKKSPYFSFNLSPKNFMVSVISNKSSSIKHNVTFMIYGPIDSIIHKKAVTWMTDVTYLASLS